MKDKYRAYSAEELIEELAYCGFDPYYNSIREPVVKEILRRLEAWERGEPDRQVDWVSCSDRLPTAEDGERVVVHPCFEKPACEYVFVPWKTVEFEYKVGHIDAWFPIPKYKGTETLDDT